MREDSNIEIRYSGKKAEKTCRDFKQAKKEMDLKVAEKLHAAINLLESIPTLNDINQMRTYNLHPLQGKRQGQYAMDLGRRSGYRLIIIPLDEDGNEWNKDELDAIYKSTKIILVWEVSNHYE